MTPFLDLAIWAFIGVILFVALEVFTEGKEYKPDVPGMIFGFVIAAIIAWLANAIPIKEILVVISVLLGKTVSKLLNKLKNPKSASDQPIVYGMTAVSNSSGKSFSDNPKKDIANYIGMFFFIGLLIVVDLNVFIKSASSDLTEHYKTFLGHWFEGKWNDWTGLILFNLIVLTLIPGLFGMWNLSESENKSSWGKVWAISLALTIGLIYL